MELNGKVISFLGDSITEGHGVENIAQNRFDNIIQREARLRAVYNYGIGGTRIAHQNTVSEKPRWDLCFCGRAYDLYQDSDIIVVFGGTNDYGHGDAPFGTLEDRTPATFCGGVDFLMRLLKELYPKAKPVFLTPLRRLGDEAVSTEAYKTPDSKPLLDYCKVIQKKGQIHKIPVLCLYEELCVDPNIRQLREAYTTDGLHLNDEGHKLLAQCVLSFLRSI